MCLHLQAERKKEKIGANYFYNYVKKVKSCLLSIRIPVPKFRYRKARPSLIWIKHYMYIR